MKKSEVKQAAIEEYQKLRNEVRGNFGFDGLDNPSFLQYFKNGAAFGYELAMKEQAEALKESTQEISIASL